MPSLWLMLTGLLLAVAARVVMLAID